MIDDIILIAALLGAIGYWLNAQKVKEIAFNATKDYCLAMEVQWLDAYIALNKLSVTRNRAGKLQLLRTFTFEFSSTGYERYNGEITMLGDEIQAITMEPYRLR
jgi:hypothetical protein